MAAKDLSDVVQAAGGAGAAVSSYSKSVADKAAYDIQAGVADNNAAIATAQRSDAIRRGQTAVVNSQMRANQIKGQQVAQMAANGVDLGSGSPLSVLSGTDFMSAVDANTLQTNALKEAWGYDVQASNYRGNADLLRYRASQESPVRSLLTTANTVAAKWYGPRKADY